MARDQSDHVLGLPSLYFRRFALSEWISRCGVMKAGPASFGGGLVQTLFYTARVGLSLFDHVGVMSFNGGVFLAAMAGFGLGFMIFGSRSFKDTGSNNNHTKFSPIVD
ncbi:hypothetical protein Bca52824_036272 [Brassica carinata]|uniref:Copper transporter n=1 Tax=Brassica carinata TaxID=52824 RepID=A0A8X7S6T7_BRACI|nr:hypothetical protein Bca52824_036272 [Brassica carinata]